MAGQVTGMMSCIFLLLCSIADGTTRSVELSVG